MKTMKNLKTIAIALVAVFTTATVSAQNKKINTETSTIGWVGKKVTGAHTGTVNFKSGTLVFDGKKLKGGELEVNMTSIVVTDLQAGKGKEKLEGHLKSEDFFGTDKYPTAKLKFKTISDIGNGNYTITADLTIKKTTQTITFDLAVSEGRARTSLSIDRTKFDIKYGSGSFFDDLGDKAIDDKFELTVTMLY